MLLPFSNAKSENDLKNEGGESSKKIYDRGMGGKDDEI